jgi:hypothetical protein
MSLLLVALIAVVLAGVTSTVAWNRSRDERRRREARIAALAAAIHDEPLDGPTPAGSAGNLFATGDLSATGDLFTTRQHAGVGFRFATVAAIGLVVCGGVAAFAVVSSSASGEATVRRESSATAPEPAKTSAIEPLELVALGHDRDGDRLTVRGVVRNPASGTALDRVTAVVFVYKGDGGFVASGRAAVDSTLLGPGGETAFTVTVPAATQIGRYRVSFRTDDRVIPHIDRRDRTGN